jgi:hypothetical protein
VNPEPDKKLDTEGDKQKLTSSHKAVLKILRNLPNGQGITGKEIVAELKKQKMTLEESTLRRHIIPYLRKRCGVINVRSKGGYLIPQV